jgi:hypothetical protein
MVKPSKSVHGLSESHSATGVLEVEHVFDNINHNPEKNEHVAPAADVESFQPVAGVDYNVTFKTWIVVAVSCCLL